MIVLRAWQPEDRPLLDAFNTPAMTAHLVASESADELDERHRRYLSDDLPGRMLVIQDDAVVAGTIGYWEVHEAEGPAWETGWSVLPEHQGRGVAERALQEMLALVRTDGRHATLHAYPSVDNAPSNALCRRAGFTLQGPRMFLFRGGELTSNDWVLAL